MTTPAPLELWQEPVLGEWCDYNDHMNVAFYMLIFDHASDAFYDHVGLGRKYRTETSGTTFAVDSHTTYNRELLKGDMVRCTSQLIGFDEKRIHHYHRMYHAEKGYLASTTEFLSLHVDLTGRKVCPFPDHIQAKLAEVLESHATLDKPEEVGRGIVTPGRK